MNKIFFQIYISLFLAASALSAQDTAITVTTEVDQVRMTIGDLITYSVVVNHIANMDVEMPGLGANLGGFQIRDYELYDPVKEKGRIVKRAEYSISTFFTGSFDIPPIQVFYKMSGDSTWQILLTEKISITVESVQEGEGQAELLDIKPPEDLPRNYKRLIFFIGLGLLVVSAVVVAILIHRHRKAGGSLLPKAPPRPPHDIALEALDLLATSDLIERGEIKVFYTEVSDIIRLYIEGRYYVQALELATWEIMNGLRGSDLEAPHSNLLEKFLQACDLVKFAKWLPPEDAHLQILNDAREFVVATQIVFKIEAASVVEEAILDNNLPDEEAVTPQGEEAAS
ncbi:hypothetical protein KAR48_11745 [bacterium]|nr:hypothetical protein [bacterium]